MTIAFLFLVFVILMWFSTSFGEEEKTKKKTLSYRIHRLPRTIIVRYAMNRFSKTEEQVTKIAKKFIELAFGVLVYGNMTYWIFHWITTSAKDDIPKFINKINLNLSAYSSIIDKIASLASLIWNIGVILFLSFVGLILISSLFSKLEEVCEKSRYGDFVKTYLRGLKVLGHLALLLLPLSLWILSWFLGDAIDSMFFTQTSYSEYSKDYYTYHTNKIMLWIGCGSIPFLFALYFPIIKGIKRCLAESKGKKILSDEIEDLRKQNDALKRELEARKNLGI